MQEEITFFDKAIQFAEHYAMFSPILVPIVLTGKWLFNYFQGVNRLADSHAELIKEVREIKENNKKLMDAEGVDIRVAPVIQGVAALAGRIERIEQGQDKILDHLLNRPQNQRRDDQ